MLILQTKPKTPRADRRAAEIQWRSHTDLNRASRQRVAWRRAQRSKRTVGDVVSLVAGVLLETALFAGVLIVIAGLALFAIRMAGTLS